MTTILSILLQVALGAIARQPNLAAGNLCGYYPQDTLTSPAPRGYEPFYISHVARHGSRYLSSKDSITFRVADTLALLAGQEMLTPDGLSLLADIRMLREMTGGRYGILTELGALEHRQICGRMYRHYKKVFSDKERQAIYASATHVGRVRKSMEAFTDELTRQVPALEIHTAVYHVKEHPANRGVYGNYMDKEEQELAKSREKSFSSAAKKLRRGYDLNTFSTRIFTLPAAISPVRTRYIAKACFRCLMTGCLTEPATMPAMDKYFTAGELYYLWLGNCLRWARYLNYPDYQNSFTRERGGGILMQIIQDADEAIAPQSHTAATLRFTHDSYMMPLMAAIPLEGTVLDCPDTEIAEQFQDYNFIYPACNVQLVFYRKPKGGKVLVKVLRNEMETLIHGLEPESGCYYDWERVKGFWRNRYND